MLFCLVILRWLISTVDCLCFLKLRYICTITDIRHSLFINITKLYYYTPTHTILRYSNYYQCQISLIDEQWLLRIIWEVGYGWMILNQVTEGF